MIFTVADENNSFFRLQSVNTLPDFIILSEQVINQGRSVQSSHLTHIFMGCYAPYIYFDIVGKMDIGPFKLLVNYNKLCIMTRSIIIRFGGIQESQSLKIIALVKI